MATNPIDSDLYGDIYGDDDENEFQGTEEEPQEEYDELADVRPIADEPSPSLATKVEETLSSSTLPQGLPPKPSPATNSTLSYSAQIAKQFSAYQQTPSQERQQRREIPLPPNPRATAGRAGFGALVEKLGPPGTSTDTVFGKKPSEMHDAGKMFIGGLNWDTTDEGLRDYFSQFGKVDACTIMRDPVGTSRGFAFMTFEDPNVVDVVLSREHSLDGKAIDPKRAIPREEHLRNTRYFVGGLSSNTTPESMRQFFADYGKVVDATVMLDRESGRSKGFGFVTFEDATNADQLIGKPGLMLDDKQIEVKAAQPRSQRDQTRTTSSHATTNSSELFDQRAQVAPPMNFSNLQNQQNPMSMLYQRSMAQGPFGMMGMNPMMNMMMNGYGMGNVLPAMNMMGGGLDPMANIGNMSMAGMGGMRLGMGPVASLGMTGNPGVIGAQKMGNTRATGMGLRNASGFNGMVGNTGLGPTRATTRGQHSFHPYSR
ncbi:RNA-binding domain-containing protein [Pholiota conissans]|uniref:RNA-binding domain-containing protein n=1 Tax=Pholiota conissans TaxID=109636 RepID=A0A9P5YP74_9AGAR|nr:RNA-binding domain-containing protein [Pholiota conissans]